MFLNGVVFREAGGKAGEAMEVAGVDPLRSVRCRDQFFHRTDLLYLRRETSQAEGRDPRATETDQVRLQRPMVEHVENPIVVEDEASDTVAEYRGRRVEEMERVVVGAGHRRELYSFGPIILPVRNKSSFKTVVDAVGVFDDEVDVLIENFEIGTWDEVEFGREVTKAAIEATGENEAWYQTDGETDRQYELFTAFLALGMGRTKQEVADAMKVTGTYVRKVGSDFDWNTRARAYDQWRQRIWSATIAEKTMEMAERHGDVAARGIRTLAMVFEAAEKKGDSMLEELSALGAKELLRYVRDAARAIPALMNAERLAIGMPTEITQNQVVSSHEVVIQTTDELAELIGNLNAVIGNRGIPDPVVIDVGSRAIPYRTDSDSEDE